MKLLTNEMQKSYEYAKICYICKKKLEDKHAKNKKHILKLETIAVIQDKIEVLCMAYVVKSIVYLKKFL